MIAIKKINNNVVICKDSDGCDVIALGKGLGFGEFPRELSLKEIDRTFYDVDQKYQQLIKELPAEVLAFADRMMAIARNQLPYELNPNQTLVLADHIAFVIERAKKHIKVKMPLAYDIRQLYPMEYKIGIYAVEKIRREFKIGIGKEEAVGIALNLMNGRLSQEVIRRGEITYDFETMLDEITDIIEEELKFIVLKESFNYARYATHMQYLFRRIKAGEAIQSGNENLYEKAKEEYRDIAGCVDHIAEHIEKKWKCRITDEERFYLVLHINRICIKEGL